MPFLTTRGGGSIRVYGRFGILNVLPANTVIPTVTGTTSVGQTLSASTGTWTGIPTPTFTYQWYRGSSTVISGATSSTYTLVEADIGNQIKVRVTATNAAGSAFAESNLTASISGVAPVNTSLPTISGSSVARNTLSASVGSWSYSPTSYSYQWVRDGSNISGATSSTYTTVDSDYATNINVRVTATNSFGSNAANSTTRNIQGISPYFVTAPSLFYTSGQPLRDNHVVYLQGTIDGVPAPGWGGTQWFADGVPTIWTGSVFISETAQIGKSITVNVAISNAVGSSTWGTLSVGTVQGNPPSNSTRPTLDKAPSAANSVVGVTITVNSVGSWTNSPTSYSYQWEQAGYGPIAGATGSSYTLQNSDVGRQVWCIVTASNQWGSSSVSTYDGSVGITQTITAAAGPPVNTSAPTISGTAQQGQTLTAAVGSWTNSPTSYSYQWKRGGVNISGATSSTFTLTASEVGNTITVFVTATNAQGSGTAESSATSTVTAAAPSNTSAPTISGTATEGNTLTANVGSWTNSPTSYSYQWQRGGSNIGGATNSTYVLVSADVGSQIRVQVTATNSGGSASAFSSYTSTVQSAPPATGQVQYTSAGTYSWTAPSGVTSVCVVCVGGGGGPGESGLGGGGGGLGYKNNISVSPGSSYTVVVGGQGTTSYFINSSTVAGNGGGRTAGGGYVGDGGGNGGAGGGGSWPGGGGAGGYSGTGGVGAVGTSASRVGGNGSGGGGGGGGGWWSQGGGGVGLLGAGSSGTAGNGTGSSATPPTGGSGGASGFNYGNGSGGGAYGGGGGRPGSGAGGAVRIIWGAGRAFPSTNTGNL